MISWRKEQAKGPKPYSWWWWWLLYFLLTPFVTMDLQAITSSGGIFSLGTLTLLAGLPWPAVCRMQNPSSKTVKRRAAMINVACIPWIFIFDETRIPGICLAARQKAPVRRVKPSLYWSGKQRGWWFFITLRPIIQLVMSNVSKENFEIQKQKSINQNESMTLAIVNIDVTFSCIEHLF